MEKNLYKFLKKNLDFPFEVKESRRARRISIKIKETTKVVYITIPRGVNSNVVNKFVEEKIGWIRKNLEKTVQPETVSLGSTLPIEGLLREVTLNENLKTNFELQSDRINLKTLSPSCGEQTRQALISLSHDVFLGWSLKYAEKLNVNFSKISIKDPKTRWGSCSSSGSLMFSWRLIMAPPVVGRYVAAHEVSHLLHLNHSKDFWLAVFSLCPNYESHRLWLKNNGKNLHKFVF